MVKKIGLSILLILLGVGVVELALKFTSYRDSNPYGRVYKFENFKLSGEKRFSVPLAKDALIQIRPDAKWTPSVDGNVDYSLREAKGMWDGTSFYLTKNFSGRSIAKLPDGSILYDVDIRTDAYGRRLTEGPKGKQASDRCLLVFGDSNVYGEGVAGSQTLASHLAKILPSVIVYNYGIPASGPYEALARLQDLVNSSEVPQKNCVGLHVFFPDHIRKSNYSLFYQETRRYFPIFVDSVSGKNLVRFNGGVPDAFPLRDFVFNFLSKSSILNFVGFNYPVKLGETEFRNTAKVLKEMDRSLTKKFATGKFFVVLFPSGELQGSFQRFLEEAEVHYLDYEMVDLPKVTKESPFVSEPYIMNPGGVAYEWLAHRIVDDLGLKR